MADQQIRAIVRGVERLTERVVTKIVFDLTANLIEGTPVDTGWARANWVPSIGTPVIENLTQVQPTPQAATAAGARQQSGLGTVAAQYRLALGSVYVSNNVPYMQHLNDGSSTQQPSGFVQRAIAKAVTQDIRGLRQ